MAKLKYNKSTGIIEVIIRDDSGAKLDHLKANLDDKLKCAYILKTLFEKYNIMIPDKDFFEF